MNLLRNSLFAALSSLMILSGCGDLFQKEVKEKSLESNRFKAGCELNIDDFTLILEEDISESIDCLGKTLHLFVKVVESKRAGYLSRTSLEKFIKRNRKDIKPEVLRALKSVFDINFLVYGEDPDFISTTNIDALVKVAKTFNQQASQNFKPIFIGRDSIDYDSYKFLRNNRILNSSAKVKTALNEIYNRSRQGKLHKLNLIDVLDSFKTETNEGSIEKVKKYLFAKRVMLGGDKDELTHLELGKLIDNFDAYVRLAMDGIRYKDIIFEQKDSIDFLKEDLTLLRNLIYTDENARDREYFFSLREVVDVAELIIEDEDIDLDDYYDLIKEAKVILMQGRSDSIVGADLKRLIDHGVNVLETGEFFHRFWISESEYLERERRNEDIPQGYQFSKLRSSFPSQTARIEHFSRILKSYRFQKGKEASATYSSEWKRSPESAFEVFAYEYVLKLVMTKYGCPNNTLNNKVICDVVAKGNQAHWGKDYVYLTKDHVADIILKFKSVFHKADLIYPGREVKTAETITLLGSLFQYQSDENKVFDVNEATEFVISLFTALEIANEVDRHFTNLAKQNKCNRDEFGRIAPDCFRANFFQAVCFNYPDNFPKLFASLGATVRDSNRRLVCRIPPSLQNDAFLQQSVNAARTCNFYPSNKLEEIYYTKGDLMSVFLAMMHIETTILRWDVRTVNNLMDPAEVMDAYNIYSPALDGFLEEMPPMVKKLKKQIYQYLVKYEQVPNEKDFGSIWKFVKFLVSFNKSATANRKTVASILVAIGEQGAPDTFNCDCLKDPTRIPEDQSQCSSAAPMRSPIQLARMTRGDISLMSSIEAETDADVRQYLKSNHPELQDFLSR